jgi:hypothetical protein
MKTLNVVTLLALLAAYVANAQTMVEDSDADGLYSKDELMVVYAAITDDIFGEVNTNDAGAVDADELAAAQASGLLAN